MAAMLSDRATREAIANLPLYMSFELSPCFHSDNKQFSAGVVMELCIVNQRRMKGAGQRQRKDERLPDSGSGVLTGLAGGGCVQVGIPHLGQVLFCGQGPAVKSCSLLSMERGLRVAVLDGTDSDKILD
ncbi:hypothetical protein SKAU_G00332730 [Synaphobranchus kaupii]|uniref:Uncharacterized protein n=1 Tax=Synaphobranchus kaupii TaxID=118154 RepID=A0A9Q1IIF4_SYNKA|nr:hypothetical protein SKAU_G00332730 [Synaphobranchus kaupii]